MRALSYLIIILLTPTIILLNFCLLVFNTKFYENLQSKSNIANQINTQVADYQTKRLIKFLKSKDSLDESFFTQREIAHMQDVKRLIRFANLQLLVEISAIILISALLIVKKRTKFLINAFNLGSFLGIGILLVISLAAYFNFEFLFINFHLISFDNDLWMLPVGSNLLKLFPQQFFVDFANRIAYQSLLMLGIIYLITVLLGRANSKQ